MNRLVFLLLVILFFSCNYKNDVVNNKVDSTKKLSSYLQQKIEFADTATDVNKLLTVVNVLDSALLYKQALVVMDKVLASDSFNSNFWLRKGQLLKQTTDTLQAIKMFAFASKIYADPPPLMEWANLLAETKNIKTLQVTKVLRNNNPSKKYDAPAYFFDGVYYAKVGNVAEAISNFNKAISQDYLFMNAYIEKGFLLYNLKKIPEALTVFQQSTTANLRFADGYYWQAKCLEAMSKKADAIEMYKQCLVLDKSIVEATEALERLQ